MFGGGFKTEYKEYAEGTWGEFSTTSGRVGFLMTRARLGQGGDLDRSVRLTSLLSPVREVLPIQSLNFSQLLQRDLDDHRVATELLPYLIRPSSTGPAFFPPVLAVLLPFDGMRAAEHFPTLELLQRQKIDGYGETAFEEQRYGSAFRVQRMLREDGEVHPVRFARFGWNTEAARLVVLDGQHRAMALLAVQRTISETWKGSPGEKYRLFYEEQVRQLLAEGPGGRDGTDANRARLEKVEFPVTLLWFPDMAGPGHQPHVAARKLFVDVNKNARLPSKARLVLLSDTELTNIFTRCLLNRLREPRPPMPLFAVEYDNPDSKSNRPVRWSVFTNLLILREIVEKAVFGPAKYLERADVAFGGRPPKADMDEFMRKQLDLASVLPERIDEGEQAEEILRESIGNEYFPRYDKEALARIERQFMSVWGDAILRILSAFAPWAAHIRAIEAIEHSWNTADEVGALAKDALFNGVGMFWTLRSTHAHWRQQVAEDKADEKSPPDIVKAWRVLDKDSPVAVHAREFSRWRADRYFGRSDGDSVLRSEVLYGVVNTYACQLAAVMTVATVRHHHAGMTPMVAAHVVVDAWNAALRFGPTQQRNRLAIFSRSIDKPLNMLGKMDSPDAVYFRYFFLELLMTEDARRVWEGTLDPAKLATLTSQARWQYIKYLVNEQDKALKKTEPGLTTSARDSKANDIVHKNVADALKHWFAVPKSEYEAWCSRGPTGSVVVPEAPQFEDYSADPSEVGSEDEGPTAEDELEQLVDALARRR